MRGAAWLVLISFKTGEKEGGSFLASDSDPFDLSNDLVNDDGTTERRPILGRVAINLDTIGYCVDVSS